MRRTPLVLAIFLLSTFITGAAIAEDTPDRAPAVARARAEAPAEPVEARPGLDDVPVATRLFYMRATEHVRTVRSIKDITGDGLDEVVATIDTSQSDNIFCLDSSSSGEATVAWSMQPFGGISNGSPYAEGSVVPSSDADDNGYDNLLVGTAWGGRSAYNLDGLDGSQLWIFDTYLTSDSGWVFSLAELNDITGDDVPEVAFGAGSYNDRVYMVNGASSGAATVLWSYYAGDVAYSVNDIGDVNNDGKHDVLAAVGEDVDRLVCLDGGTANPAGHVLWTYNPGTSVYSSGVLPDITGDGVDEALVVLWTLGGGAVGCVNGATGTHIWTSTSVANYGVMVDTLKDVTGDGHDEVVVSSWENAVIVLNGFTGELLWKTPVGTANGSDVWVARAIDDLNGDGNQDVIAGSFDGSVYAMDGKNGTILWTFPTGYKVMTIYPVGDLTGDGVPEVVAGNQNLNHTNNIVVHVLDGGAAWPTAFSDGFESGDTSAWSATVP